MEFFRLEYWSGLPLSTPGGLPNPGIKPMSLVSPALAGRFFTPRATWKAPLREWPQLKNEADMKGLSASHTSHIWAFSWKEIWTAQLHFTSCVTELLLFLAGSSWSRISVNHLHWRKTRKLVGCNTVNIDVFGLKAATGPYCLAPPTNILNSLYL